MARMLRIEYPGAIYHVTCRLVGSWADGDRDLYRDDADRWRFLDALGSRVEGFGIVLHQYVLMQNHFHLVVGTPRGNCSAFMQSLLTAYTVYFNQRHGRHGHLFDGRYKAKLVEGDNYLLSLSRYVHLNPVRVGALRENPAEARRVLRTYYWSSYLQYVGQRKCLTFLSCRQTLAQMGGAVKDRPARYRKFVQAGITKDDEDFVEAMGLSRLGIGGVEFRDQLQALYTAAASGVNRREDVTLRRREMVLSADAVIKTLAGLLGCEPDAFKVRGKGTARRPFAAHFLTRYAGLSQRDVAQHLGVSTGAAVCLQLRRFEELTAADRKLRKLAAACRDALDKQLRKANAV